MIAASFGWLFLCGAQPPGEEAKSATGARNSASAPKITAPSGPILPAAPVAKFTAYPGYNPDPCYKAEDKDAADLCAQWRAAIAGEKAAHEARRATGWSIIATFLNFLGLVAVCGALYLTVQSNRIARDTAKRQLRAYLSIEPGGVNEAENGLCRVPVLLTNAGQTPAHDLEHFGDFLIISGNPREFDPAEHGRFRGNSLPTNMVLGANGEQWNYAYMPEKIAEPHWKDIAGKTKAIVHYGFVAYRDVFNERHETHFAFYHWGEELSAAESKRCRLGNQST